MDCYSVESEFIESLDFLSPPVKRIHTSREAFQSIYQHEPSNVHLLRGLRNKFVRRDPSAFPRHTRTVKTNAESSTSLILKKTSERQILEHYSILSYTSLQNQGGETPRKPQKYSQNLEKPIIQVTVIPKGDQHQTAKILRKRRLVPKNLQNTTSNHENSVQTKNVYLIVAGRRKEKIYEIKTTGSAQFSTDHESYSRDDELPVKEISHFKHLIKSLSMDKKKKKSKAIPSESARVPTVECKGGYPTCSDCLGKETPAQAPKRSRVRIFGQFGISEDDKYVLRYGATVNDKEVLSDVAKLTRDFSPVINEPTLNYDISCDEDPVEKDVVAQLQEDINKFEVRAVTEDTDDDDDDVPSKESQATQVNFNIQVSSADFVKNRQLNQMDKTVQCCCQADSRSTHKLLKDCQSPLVIISVYPKHSTDESDKASDVDRFQAPALINAYTSNQIIKTDKGTKKSDIDTSGSFKRRPRSPEPSPIKKASKPKMLGDATGSREASPDRHRALRAIKDKIKEKDEIKQNKLNKIAATSNGRLPTKITQNVTTQVHPSNKAQQNFKPSNASRLNQKPITRQRINHNESTSYNYSKPLQQQVNPDKFTNINMQIKTPDAPGKRSHAFVATTTQNTRQQNLFSKTKNMGKTFENTESCGTQASAAKNKQNFTAPRLSKKEPYTVPNKIGFKADTTPRNNMKLREKENNTGQALAKKVLVETYTKKLTEKMKEKDITSPRYDGSKLKINIDGDKEYYDVLFNQDRLSTDITIRKRVKDMGSQVGYDDERSLSSLQNVLPTSENAARTGVWRRNKSPPPKALSVTIGNKPSDGGSSPFPKCASRITIRDSLEISHRREDKGTCNMKNTQTCFTAQFAEDIPDETEFLAPIKHYTGDDCSICDPMERDRQIRQLLGVDKNKHSNKQMNKISTAHFTKKSELHVDPYQYIYRQQCEKKQVAEINFQFNKFCPFKHKPAIRTNPIVGKSVAVQCHHTSLRTRCNTSSYLYDEPGSGFNYNDPSPLGFGNEPSPLYISQPSGPQFGNEFSYDSVNSCKPCKPNFNYPHKRNGPEFHEGTHAKKHEKYPETKEKAAIYQQLILNRNIQVFLQVDQFSKQKPIILSRKQYNKVKRTIQKTICRKKSSHDKRKKALGIDINNKNVDKNEFSSSEREKHKHKNELSPGIKKKYDHKNELISGDEKKIKHKIELSSGDENKLKNKNEVSSGNKKRYEHKNELFAGDDKKNKHKNEVSSGDENKLKHKNVVSSGNKKRHEHKNELFTGDEKKIKHKNELTSGDENKYKHKNELFSGNKKRYEPKNELSSGDENKCLKHKYGLSSGDENKCKHNNELSSGDENKYIKHKCELSSDDENKYIKHKCELSSGDENKYNHKNDNIYSGNKKRYEHKNELVSSDENLNHKCELSSGDENKYNTKNKLSSSNKKRYEHKNELISSDENKYLKHENELSSGDENKYKHKNELISDDENKCLKHKYGLSSGDENKCLKHKYGLSSGDENKYKHKNVLSSDDERRDEHKNDFSSGDEKKYGHKNELFSGNKQKYKYKKEFSSGDEKGMRSSDEARNRMECNCGDINMNALMSSDDQREYSDKDDMSFSNQIRKKHEQKPPITSQKKKKKDKKLKEPKEATSSEVSVGEIRKKGKGDPNAKGAQTDKCTRDNCINDVFKDLGLNRKKEGGITGKTAIKKQKDDLKNKRNKSKPISATFSGEVRLRKLFGRKRKEDSNTVILPFNRHASCQNDSNEKEVEGDRRSQLQDLDSMLTGELRDRILERQKIRNAECTSGLYRENVGEINPQKYGQLNTDFSTQQYSAQLRDNVPEKLYEPGMQTSPDCYSEQKSQQNLELRDELNPDNRRDRYPEYNENQSLAYRRDCSPECRRGRGSEYRGDRTAPGIEGDRSLEYRTQIIPEYEGDRGPELRNNLNPEFRGDISLEYRADRHLEHRGVTGPGYKMERSSERRRARSPERRNERKREQSPVPEEIIFDRQKQCNSPQWHRERAPERRRDLSTERQRDRSSGQHREIILERCNERSRKKSSERHKTTQAGQIYGRYIDEKRKDHSYDLCIDENKSIISEIEDIANARLVEVGENIGEVMETGEVEVKTLVLFNADHSKDSKNEEAVKDSHTRKTMSSVEIRYASVAYMKQLAYSSTDVGAISDSSMGHVNSFHTIFRGHRKSPTPNLGTSAYSLYSEELNSDKSAKFKEPRESKPKKPFLRRLMSCLVMRSRESELKLPVGPIPDPPSVNSSIDSYHISTSLCAVEVSSSIYDTSASFYSNHTILPVNSKIKRGFFSSVRGFLTNRKS